MDVNWVFHRYLRAEYSWIDTPDSEALATIGVLAPGDRLEATLSLDGQVDIRDGLWPLAWRFCLDPVIGLLARTATEWSYSCFEQNMTYTLRVSGDEVQVIERDGREAAFVARELWPAMVDAAAFVVALAERDRGPADRDVGFLRPPLERAQAALREYGIGS